MRASCASLMVAITLAKFASPAAAASKCPPDSVQAGPVCVDKYEASVWQIPGGNPGLVRAVQLGRATLVSLTAAQATQLGVEGNDYGCPASGNGCTDIYAVSIPGVVPSRYATWFVAQQACMNSLKRLLTNAEWQGAAAGTPDPGTDDGLSDCNTGSTFRVVDTGSRENCKSARGAFDMVGNADEWVADWSEAATGCWSWGPSFGNDYSCVGGDGTTHLPGALIRGGNGIEDGPSAGVFAVDTRVTPETSGAVPIGFRCGR